MDESAELLKRSYDKFKSAQVLFDNGLYEDSVSRSYYSMLFAARSLLAMKEIYPKTHGGIIKMLGLEFVTTGYLDEVAGRAIATAKEDREEADYGILTSITKEEAEETLNDAKDFIHKIEEAEKHLNE